MSSFTHSLILKVTTSLGSNSTCDNVLLEEAESLSAIRETAAGLSCCGLRNKGTRQKVLEDQVAILELVLLFSLRLHRTLICIV